PPPPLFRPVVEKPRSAPGLSHFPSGTLGAEHSLAPTGRDVAQPPQKGSLLGFRSERCLRARGLRGSVVGGGKPCAQPAQRALAWKDAVPMSLFTIFTPQPFGGPPPAGYVGKLASTVAAEGASGASPAQAPPIATLPAGHCAIDSPYAQAPPS